MTVTDQIVEEFNKESAPGFRRPPLERADQIPYSYEDITDAWLTDVLCRDIDGAQVVAHHLDKFDDGSSNRRRIHLQYNAAGSDAQLPASVFCKAAQSLNNRILLGATGALHAESTFFGHVRPQIELNIPRSHLSIYDPVTYRSILVLEDLGGRAELCNIIDTHVNRARAESQIDLLAAFHATFAGRPDLGTAPLDFITWPEWFDNLIALGIEQGTQNGFEAAESVIPTALFKQKSRIWPLTVQAARLHNELPATLIHSDVHLGNWFCTEGDSMGLLDWQAICRGHWSRDLAYVISSALTVEDRRSWENDLLRRYIEQFERHGGEPITFEFAQRAYRRQLFGALAFWTITLTPSEAMPDMQTEQISLRNIERIATAVDDLDAVDAFDDHR